MKHHDIQYFLGLQDRFIDLLKYISCNENNFSCYSVKNESLIVDICSFFDSLCQTYISDLHYSGHVFINQTNVKSFLGKIQKKSNFNAGDYRKLLEGDSKLSIRAVNLNLYEDHLFIDPLGYHPDEIDGYQVVPFKEWGAGTQTKWWDSFTKLKHNRVLNHREATLRNVVFSLAAVFVILCLENEAAFMEGRVPPDIYRAFLPKFWKFYGRLMPGIFRWK
ncbi:MAG: hypothetical protein ACLQUW_10145 [Desulfobaccales bacterium]